MTDEIAKRIIQRIVDANVGMDFTCPADEEEAEQIVSKEIERLQKTIDRKQAAKLVLQKEVAEQRTKDAQLVRDMLEMPQWKQQAWARMALTVAARAIERGYHWTPDERLDNLFDALMEEAQTDDEGEP